MALAAADGNSRGANHSQQEVVDHYLQWAEIADGQLRNVLDADLVADLIHTTGYWALRNTAKARIDCDRG